MTTTNFSAIVHTHYPVAPTAVVVGLLAAAAPAADVARVVG